MTTHVDAPVADRIQAALAEERPRRVDGSRVPLSKALLTRLSEDLKKSCARLADGMCDLDVKLGITTEVDSQVLLLTKITVAEGMAAAIRQLQEELMREANQAEVPDTRIAKARGVSPQAVAQQRQRLSK